MYKKIEKYKFFLLIFLILILGCFLRFYKLSENPPGLYVDEAAIGYNVYSILKTGKDEYGQSFPFYFRSFGDYKMPLYIYVSVLPIWLFGLTPFAVRFISAFVGLLTIIVLYYFIKLVFPEKGTCFALINCFLFAISPWSIFFSRGAFEANLGLFLLILSLYFQLKAFKTDKLRHLAFSAVLYSLSTYSYHTEKYLSPFFFLVLIMVYIIKRRNDTKVYLRSVISLMLFILLIFPQVFLFSSTAGQSRIKSLSIINKESEQNKQSKQFSITRPLSLYVAYYSPRNLFFDPDPDRQRSLPELSVFYPWMIAPFIAGLYLFFREKVAGNKKIILFMLFISPIPASFAGDPFSSLRASPLIFPMTVIISFGIDRIFQFLKNNILKVALITLILCVSLTSLYRNLFVLLPGERFNDWNYGYSQLIEKIKTTPAPKILINDPKGTSYIELLFFLRQSPKDYQSQTLGNRPQNYYNDGVWVNTFSWSNIQVRPIIWKDDIYTYQLLVSSPLGISEDQAKEHYLTKAFDIIGPDRRIIFNGYLTNPLLKNSDDKAKLKKMLK